MEGLKFCPFCNGEKWHKLNEVVDTANYAWPTVSHITEVECETCGAELRVTKSIEVEVLANPPRRGWANY